MSEVSEEKITNESDFKIEIQSKLFKTNKEKLTGLLLNAITFLDTGYYQINSLKTRDYICLILEIFENLLKIQGFTCSYLSDKDFSHFKKFISQTTNQVLKKIIKDVEKDE